jgi:hypothetical protein
VGVWDHLAHVAKPASDVDPNAAPDDIPADDEKPSEAP